MTYIVFKKLTGGWHRNKMTVVLFEVGAGLLQTYQHVHLVCSNRPMQQDIPNFVPNMISCWWGVYVELSD